MIYDTKYMKRDRVIYAIIIFVIFTILCIFLIIPRLFSSSFFSGAIIQSVSSTIQITKDVERKKPVAQIVKGVYLTAYSAGNEKKIDEIIALVEKTELNAVVIDIKDYSGRILYNSAVPLVLALHSSRNQIGDVRALIKKLHDHDIYTIARQTVFQDPFLADNKPEWAIKNNYNGVWRDHKGLSWVDPSRREVWEYNIAIAREAIALGFDEINFDYVRFPSDGDMQAIVYSDPSKKRYEVMYDFFHFLNIELSDESAWVSIDMFGFVMEKEGSDDMNIGQRLVDATTEVDYICPMMYPSHYPVGHLGFSNPADYPGEVIHNGMKKGTDRFKETRAKIRPWLQAFNIGAVYDGEKIRAQIDAVEAYSDAGWLLWNAANRYSADGLDIAS